MDVDQLRPIVSGRKGLLMLGTLALLVSAAPDGARLVFDPSAFADDGCLAPDFAGDGCSYGTSGERRTGLSASAALLEPETRRERETPLPGPGAMLLEPQLSGLLDFGPEVVHRVPPQRIRRVPALQIAVGSEE